jgi:hypothetical protein
MSADNGRNDLSDWRLRTRLAKRAANERRALEREERSGETKDLVATWQHRDRAALSE